MTNINLTDPEEKIAKDLIREFNYHGCYDYKVNFAIKCVEFALMVCPEILNESCVNIGIGFNNGYNFRRKNPNHFKLEKVLEILKSKL